MKKTYFLFRFILFLFSLLLISCEDFSMFGDPVEGLDSRAKFTVYLKESDSTYNYDSVMFRAGQKINVSDFCKGYKSSGSCQVKPGYKTDYWKFSVLNTIDISDIPEVVYHDGDNIESFIMPASDVYLYGADWKPRTDNPVTVKVDFGTNSVYYQVQGETDSNFDYDSFFKSHNNFSSYQMVSKWYCPSGDDTDPQEEAFDDSSVIRYGSKNFYIISVKRKTVTVTIKGGDYGVITAGDYDLTDDNTIVLTGSENAGLPLTWPDVKISVSAAYPDYVVDLKNWNYSYTDENNYTHLGTISVPQVYPDYDTVYSPVYNEKPSEGDAKTYDISYKLVGKTSDTIKDINVSVPPYNGIFITEGKQNEDLTVCTAGSDYKYISSIYYDSECTKLVEYNDGKYLIPAGKVTSDHIDLYVRAEKADLYVSPVSGNDNNTGLDSSCALSTISEAYKYHFDPARIYLTSQLSDIEQIKLCNGNSFVYGLSDSTSQNMISVENELGEFSITITGDSNVMASSCILGKVNLSVSWSQFESLNSKITTGSTSGSVIEIQNYHTLKLDRCNFDNCKNDFPLIYAGGKEGEVILTDCRFTGNTNYLNTSSAFDVYSNCKVVIQGTCVFDGILSLGETGILYLDPYSTGDINVDLDNYEEGRQVLGEADESKITRIHLRNAEWDISATGSLVKKGVSLSSVSSSGSIVPPAGSYCISDVNDILALQSLCNNAAFNSGDGYSFKLTDSIDMSGVTDFKGIGTFKGDFDGNNFAIKNYEINDSSNANHGFFSAVTGGSHKNIKFESCKIISTSSTASGIYCGMGDGGEFENIRIIDCTIESNGTGVGGIIGEQAPQSIVNCSAEKSTIKGSSMVGGISGALACSISDCTVDLYTVITATGDYAGGIVGYISGISGESISSCKSSATVTASKNAGGIAGSDDRADIIDCHNTGIVTATSFNAGGIAGSYQGSDSGASVIDKCSNIGNISALSEIDEVSVGGIVGSVLGKSVVIRNSYNSGTISGFGWTLGGISGNLTSSARIVNCYNTASITGNSTESSDWRIGIGGIAGSVSGGTIINSYNSGGVTGGNSAAICHNVSGDLYNCYALKGCNSALIVTSTGSSIVDDTNNSFFEVDSFILSNSIFKCTLDGTVKTEKYSSGTKLLDALNSPVSNAAEGVYFSWKSGADGLPVFDN